MNMNKRGLGKGLDALLATSSAAHSKQQHAERAQSLSTEGTFKDLPLNQLQPGQYQPRKVMADEALAELAESIKAQALSSRLWYALLLKNGMKLSLANAAGVRLVKLAFRKSLVLLRRLTIVPLLQWH